MAMLIVFLTLLCSACSLNYELTPENKVNILSRTDNNDKIISFHLDEFSKEIWTTKINDQINEISQDSLISFISNLNNGRDIEQDAALLNILGIISYNFEELNSSLEHFINACEISSYKIIEYILNAASLMSGEFSLQIQRRGAVTNPRSSLLINNVLEIYHRNGNRKKILRFIVELVRIDPEYYPLWKLLINHQIQALTTFTFTNLDAGEVLNPTDTMDILSLGLSIYPNSPGLRYLIGTAYHRSNDFSCALEYYHGALKKTRFAEEGLIQDVIKNRIIEVNIKNVIDERRRQWNDTNSGSSRSDDVITEEVKYNILKDPQENTNILQIPDTLLNYTCLPFSSFAKAFQSTIRLDQPIFTSPSQSLFNGTPPPLPLSEYNDILHEQEIKIGIDSTTKEVIQGNIPRNVHLGCNDWEICSRQDWIVVDGYESVITHFQLSAMDLWPFPNGSVDKIYTSHMLEHLAYMAPDCEVCRALQEWRRVLRINGTVLISVPDLQAMSSIMTDKDLPYDVKYTTMVIMFGGQKNDLDYHKTGFFEEFLRHLLEKYGFCDIQRRGKFGLFSDFSEYSYMGRFLSLNVEARAC